MAEAPNLKPRCPKCRKSKPVNRNYAAEASNVRDATPKTVGELALRNSERMSADEKAHLTKEHNKYKDEAFVGPVPEGGSLIPRDKDGRRLPSQQQRRVDPRK
jgi:hypothetical protein